MVTCEMPHTNRKPTKKTPDTLLNGGSTQKCTQHIFKSTTSYTTSKSTMHIPSEDNLVRGHSGGSRNLERGFPPKLANCLIYSLLQDKGGFQLDLPHWVNTYITLTSYTNIQAQQVQILANLVSRPQTNIPAANNVNPLVRFQLTTLV